jgi:hypothetical protein
MDVFSQYLISFYPLANASKARTSTSKAPTSTSKALTGTSEPPASTRMALTSTSKALTNPNRCFGVGKNHPHRSHPVSIHTILTPISCDKLNSVLCSHHLSADLQYRWCFVQAQSDFKTNSVFVLSVSMHIPHQLRTMRPSRPLYIMFFVRMKYGAFVKLRHCAAAARRVFL